MLRRQRHLADHSVVCPQAQRSSRNAQAAEGEYNHSLAARDAQLRHLHDRLHTLETDHQAVRTVELIENSSDSD